MFVGYLRTTTYYGSKKLSSNEILIVYLNIGDHYNIFMRKVCTLFSVFPLKIPPV